MANANNNHQKFPTILQTAQGHAVQGDNLEWLRSLKDASIDLIVTSPPYDGQPKYQDNHPYDRAWYQRYFLEVTKELHRILKPTGNFVLNYRSRRYNKERGLLQYELVFWLREQGWLFIEDFIWGKPSPPPGRFKQCLKDAVEYCFQFAKTRDFQFYPTNYLQPARWDKRDRDRRKRLAHNYERVDEPSGHGRKRVQAGPDWVRPSTLIIAEPEFGPNPSKHPCRFPETIPEFFIKLMTLERGEANARPVVCDPFAGTGTTGIVAERLGRDWLMCEINPQYAEAIKQRFAAVKKETPAKGAVLVNGQVAKPRKRKRHKVTTGDDQLDIFAHLEGRAEGTNA